MVIHKFKSIIGKLVLHFYEIVAEVYQKHKKKKEKKRVEHQEEPQTSLS